LHNAKDEFVAVQLFFHLFKIFLKQQKIPEGPSCRWFVEDDSYTSRIWNGIFQSLPKNNIHFAK
jgi:hypothetical protein